MLAGMAFFVAGMGAVVIWRSYAALVASLILVALCKIVFDPAMQSFLGDRVAYNQRGLAVALTEFGWSGAFLLGMPLVAWLMARYGWQTPFPVLMILGLAILITLWRILPSHTTSPAGRLSFSLAWRAVLARPQALAALGASLVISTAYDIVGIVFGVWLEQAFGLQVIALGAASLLIGVAEFSGEGLVAGAADRLGKRRTVALGMACGAASCVALPLISSSLTGALTALFLIYLSFEVAIVSAIPMMTELVPGARATVMAGNVAALSFGRALGAWLGPALFSYGMWANSLTAAILAIGAMAVLLLFVRVE
jgi:predicted MFS family arabinose efflux permease